MIHAVFSWRWITTRHWRERQLCQLQLYKYMQNKSYEIHTSEAITRNIVDLVYCFTTICTMWKRM